MVIITGSYQSPEKLIPKTIINCINKKIFPFMVKDLILEIDIGVDDHVDKPVVLS